MVAPGIHALLRHLHIHVQWPSWLTKSPGAILNIAERWPRRGGVHGCTE
jgi:hypothetical protein